MESGTQVKRNLTLEELRVRTKKSRSQLAAEVGVSGEKTVYDWERNGVLPRIDKVIALSRSLGVPLRTLCESLNLDLTGVPVEETESA